MAADDPEDARLRATAFLNAESILAARRRAEAELLTAKEALERKTEELQQQREWLTVTLSSIGDAVIATDIEGRVTFMNPVAEALTGWTSSEATGQPLDRVFRIVNEETRQPVENPVAVVLREARGVALANHTALVRKDGSEVAIEDSAAPIRDANGMVTGAVMVFHDVTVRRRAEAALKEETRTLQREIARREEAEAELRKTDRRKDEFLATLAHELRNPLAPIRQAALISKTATATEAQKRWSHDVISRQVQHMSLLLDDLLDVSRITRGTLQLRKEATELVSVVDAAVETARPSIDAKRHRLSIDVPGEPVLFAADPLRLAQVLSNLLTNAAKYTDPEGDIRLVARHTSESVTIKVIDTGIGIAPEGLRRIFRMFSQVTSADDRSDGGLGIGLALAKGLVELHGGEIQASSGGLGQGSEFTVCLPMGTLAVPALEGPEPGAEPGTVVPRRVLIADDNRDAADTLAMLLRLEGHEVMTVHDGEQALAAITTFKPEYALLDIGMPGFSGYEVAEQVRRGPASDRITLIAVTGWGQHSDKARAQDAGFDHHFTKPIEPGQLIAVLRAPGGEPSGA